MALWNQPGAFWNSTLRWGPAYFTQAKPQTNQTKNMKRQTYYPSRLAQQVEWLENYRLKLGNYTAELPLDPAVVTSSVADARWLIYVINSWLNSVRAFAPACTEAVEDTLTGTGTDPFILPVFIPPVLPAGVAPVPAGALSRIFAQVQIIKNLAGYSDAIGDDLRIVGAEDASDHPVPKLFLSLEQGDDGPFVRIRFFKYTHMGVVVESRRGASAWEFLAIDTESPYDDLRSVLAPGQPEVREYRLRYWDKGTANGPWTDVGKIIVA
jgi:hypothetical protein